MTMAVAVQTSTALMPAFSDEEAKLIRQVLCPDATDAHLRLFAQVCKSKGLSPFNNQISMQLRNTKGGMKKPVFITHIDGLRVKAARTDGYAGSDEPEYVDNADGSKPVSCRMRVWRMVQGQRVAFSSSVRWAEFAVTGYGGDMWAKMPFHMLGKVAEAQALRKAFPEELGDLYIREEMDQAHDDDAPAPAASEPAQVVTEQLKAKASSPLPHAHRARRGITEISKLSGLSDEQILDQLGVQSLDQIDEKMVRDRLVPWYDRLKSTPVSPKNQESPHGQHGSVPGRSTKQ